MAKDKRLMRPLSNIRPLVMVYYLFFIPPAAASIIALTMVLQDKTVQWYIHMFAFFLLLGIIILFFCGRRWTQKQLRLVEQYARDLRATQVFLTFNEQEQDEKVGPFTLYLRPFSSTGQIRLALGSSVHKRGVLAGPSFGSEDAELGRTNLYKRYVSFGDFETLLADVVEDIAPLVALGKTGEQLGAGRIETNDQEWQQSFQLLAKYAGTIILVPSTHPGTQWEIDFLFKDADLLRKTVLFIPSNDTVLGNDVGPHLALGAGKGPIGKFDLRKEAISALAKRVDRAVLEEIKFHKYGGLLQLTGQRRLDFFHPLQLSKGRSLNPYTIGSNLHIDQADLEFAIKQAVKYHSD